MLSGPATNCNLTARYANSKTEELSGKPILL